MDGQVEKVYVALGNDLQDGFKTLDWTLRKWKSSPISIVILHLTCSDISKDFVYTPFGKLPASSVSDEKLEVLRKFEQEKIDKLLSKYIAFCGKMKADILKVERSDETIYKAIVDLIFTHRITKLVMGITFMKSSSSWRSKSAISGSFYIHQYKPNFCELFIICGGKLVFLKGENEEGTMEDDQGVMVAKKSSFRSWLGKMFTDNSHDSHRLSASSKTLDSLHSRNQWEDFAPEIENYFKHLLSLNLDEEICKEENEILQASLTESDVAEDDDSTMVMTVAAKMASMRSKVEEAQKMIQKKREESKVNSQRCAKAEWAICLCNSRVEELEAKIKEDFLNRIDLSKSLDAEKEQIQETRRDVQESKNRLSSLAELQSELSSKLQTSTMARSHVEVQLEKAVVGRAEMVREIEELRRQRDVLQRRIEFCKEKDAIGAVAKLNELKCGYREYTAEDIRSATDNFSESLRLKSGGDWTNVYRGRINHTTVAIKMLNSDHGFPQEAFLAKVKALSSIRHPHLVAMIGFCSEPKCFIFEYMHYGSLRDILFSSSKRNRAFRWNDRIRVAYEICSGLGFLHSARPRPIDHVPLTASKVLIDRNLFAKISSRFRLTQSSDEKETLPSIQAFGVLLFQLLTGRNWTGLVEEVMAMDQTDLFRVLDERAGQWPLDLAQELVGIALRCFAINQERSTDFSLPKAREELEKIRRKADDLVAKSGCQVAVNGSIDDREDSIEAPSMFLCPILREVMKNPHIAADGFSYELEAIEEWLSMGRDTSPMTNLMLKHKFLTPNHTLRSLIQEWMRRKSTAS
ncbi:unnamed protein product [Dovyalis caffra]|uniref:RING-type E3 ubiquitin transferase n=1 Tax=Dovyalis caffra TaxID=77055 RepID=A0AAV1RWD2_9ROSI|nr:unnamed protein product [Dovyalis caffra]